MTGRQYSMCPPPTFGIGSTAQDRWLPVSCIPTYTCKKSAIVPDGYVNPSRDIAKATIPAASRLP